MSSAHSLSGFVYGGYDRNAGTIFIAASTRGDADSVYNEALGQSAADEDFLFQANLHSAVPIPDGDLENDIVCGIVIGRGDDTKWPPPAAEEYHEPVEGIVDLEFVPSNGQPVMFREGYKMYRWDSDYYSFIVSQ